MKQCLCTKSLTCKNKKSCHHAKQHDCIVPAYDNNKGMCSHNKDAECFVVGNRCDKWEELINELLHKINYLTELQNSPPME